LAGIPPTLEIQGVPAMNIYYVYIYYTPDNVPFYVGYGKNKRLFSHLNEAKKSLTPVKGEHKLNKIRKILKNGDIPTITIVASGLSREDACNLEITTIAKIGRIDLGTGPLTNKTRGGDGTVIWSDDLKNKISNAHKGRVTVKDLTTGEQFQISIDDPRWMSESVVGINYGKSGVSNPNGQLDGYILAKDSNGVCYRVKPDDPRWVSGELVGFHKNNPCHENTKIAASKRWKGIPKSQDHNKKNSDSVKLLKWYCNFNTNQVKRFRENEQPAGYVRVSGPHKREIL
jgi:hypothetical protein